MPDYDVRIDGLYYALYDDETGTYGEMHKVEGAVSLHVDNYPAWLSCGYCIEPSCLIVHEPEKCPLLGTQRKY